MQADIKAGGKRAVYIAFDALFASGEDLRAEPLTARKERLAEILAPAGKAIHYGDHIEGRQEALYEQAAALGLEGIVAKKPDSRYRSGRSDAWVKVRAVRTGAFVIGGYTADGGRLGSLLVGAWDGEQARPDGPRRHRLRRRQRQGASRQAEEGRGRQPVHRQAREPGRARGRLRRARICCRRRLSHRDRGRAAPAGRLQGPVEDEAGRPCATQRRPPRWKPPKSPAPSPPPERRPPSDSDGRFAGVTFTHPEKVLFADQKVTKAALAEHYLAHMDRMLPHVEGRPLTLVRCPQGSGKKCFYQRHPEGLPEGMAADVGEDDGLAITVSSAADVMELVQRGVLEIHLRGARADRPERPDRLVFDLDPAEDVDFDELRQAAFDLRDKLAGLDLVSFVKTTGGKGLHVLVPIERRTDWPDAKAWTRAFSAEMADAEPGRFLITASKARRKGRIFLDYLRNDLKASAVAPYSTRSRPGAPFSVPITWEMLEAAGSLPVWHVGEIVEGPDPWAGVADVRQRLTAAHLKMIG